MIHINNHTDFQSWSDFAHYVIENTLDVRKAASEIESFIQKDKPEYAYNRLKTIMNAMLDTEDCMLVLESLDENEDEKPLGQGSKRPPKNTKRQDSIEASEIASDMIESIDTIARFSDMALSGLNWKGENINLHHVRFAITAFKSIVEEIGEIKSQVESLESLANNG